LTDRTRALPAEAVLRERALAPRGRPRAARQSRFRRSLELHGQIQAPAAGTAAFLPTERR